MTSQDPNDCQKIPARRRRTPWAIGLAAVALVASVIVAPPANAGMIGPYNINGAIPDDPTFATLPDFNGNVKELGPLNSSTTKIGVIHNDALPTLGETNPNSQVDLNLAWLDTKRVGTNDFLYFAWQRDKEVGSGFIAYEFMRNAAPTACGTYDPAQTASLIANCNPWANRAAGDFMILWDQQGGSTKLLARVWTGTAPNLVLSQSFELTNYEAQYSADGFRGEAAINLTANNIGSAGQCLSFANIIPSTVTGNSDTADYKDTILNRVRLGNCSSTTVTTPQTAAGGAIAPSGASIGTGVLAVRDQAVVDLVGGSAAPSGTVNFWLCQMPGATGTCDGLTQATTGVSIGSTNVTDADNAFPVTVNSPTAYVTSAGRYCWRAEFSGIPASEIPGSSDSRTSECFTVNPVQPTLATMASGNVYVGGELSDTATLSGLATQPANPVINKDGTAGPAATGTVTFTLYGPDNCSTAVYTSPAVAVVNGSATTPAPLPAPLEPGEYHWKATYDSGTDPNNLDVTGHNTACTDENENVFVQTVPTALTTAQTWVPNDTVKITTSSDGAGNLDGTATFTLYKGLNCDGDVVLGPVNVDVAGPSGTEVGTSNTTAVPAGDYSWKVSYASDKAAHEDIGASCHESSSLTVNNGGTVNSSD
jgi:hypothetical protein